MLQKNVRKARRSNAPDDAARIKFSVPAESFVSLKVYDALGKNISNLLNENMNPGVYFSPFNGEGLSSGVYFYTLETKDISTGRVYKEAKKMLIVK